MLAKIICDKRQKRSGIRKQTNEKLITKPKLKRDENGHILILIHFWDAENFKPNLLPRQTKYLIAVIRCESHLTSTLSNSGSSKTGLWLFSSYDCCL